VGRVVLALLLLVAGCGGSDASHAEAADAVCAEANKRVDALGFEPPILTAAQAAWVEHVGQIGREAVADLRALEPPAKDWADVAAMVAAFDRGFASSGAIASASRAGDEEAFRLAAGSALDELQEGRSAASLLGLDACAALGRGRSGPG
jgi:hypothetical protein